MKKKQKIYPVTATKEEIEQIKELIFLKKGRNERVMELILRAMEELKGGK